MPTRYEMLTVRPTDKCTCGHICQAHVRREGRCTMAHCPCLYFELGGPALNPPLHGPNTQWHQPTE